MRPTACGREANKSIYRIQCACLVLRSRYLRKTNTNKLVTSSTPDLKIVTHNLDPVEDRYSTRVKLSRSQDSPLASRSNVVSAPEL